MGKDKKEKKDKNVYAIDQVRKYISQRKSDLDECSDWARADEDSRFDATMDKLVLDWKVDADGTEEEIQSVYLYFSSAVRDRSTYPSPGQYLVSLDTEIDNIIESSLIQASFPLSDPTVNRTNNKIRYSFVPFLVIETIEIPIGSYKGEALAIEITRQLNQSKFSTQIPAPYLIDSSNGSVVDATGILAPGEEQFKVAYILSSRKFVFQLIDDAGLPVNTDFALHIQPLPTDKQQPWTSFNDDLYSLLGYNRDIVASVATYEPISKTYYLQSTVDYEDFGPALSVDQRFSYSISGNQYSDLRGSWVVILDINPLNTNDIVCTKPGPDKRFSVGNCFGAVLVKDPAHSSEGMLEISTMGYPCKKYYRNGRSRVSQLLVTLRRPDGTIYDFGGLDHFLALKLEVKRTQPDKPVFCR